MESKSIGRFRWVIAAVLLAYWGALALFGPGHESKGWEHFAHALKGISLELGSCSQPPPDSENDRAGGRATVLSAGDLVSAEFEKGERVSYGFLRGAGSSGEWRVVGRVKSDYKGLMGFGGKIWLMEFPEVDPGEYLLVTGAGGGREDPIADGSLVHLLPSTLDYTALSRVKVVR